MALKFSQLIQLDITSLHNLHCLFEEHCFIFSRIRGAGIGVKRVQANSFLEKKLKRKNDLNYDETLQVFIH